MGPRPAEEVVATGPARPVKVVAYVVHRGRLLVFTHPDDPSYDVSGLQVPAGTVEPGESPDEAVLREAREETGLAGLTVERFLGVAEYDMRPYADAVHVRHHYQLSVAGDPPERWYAGEVGIRFEFSWIPLAHAHAVAAGQAALVGRMSDR